MGLLGAQQFNAVHVYQFSVCADDGVHVADSDTGGDFAQIYIAAIFDCLLQQSVHRLPLGRNVFGVFGHNDIHRNAAIQLYQNEQAKTEISHPMRSPPCENIAMKLIGLISYLFVPFAISMSMRSV